LVSVIVPPSATVPPPDNPDPATTFTEGLANIVLLTPAAGILIVPVPVIGPPVNPAPVATLVTVPPEAVLESVTVPPNATAPPPVSPVPATTLMEGFASIVFVTPADGMLIVPLAVIGPPVNPAPVATFVTVPVAVLVSVTVPPNATVPPPDNPDPATTFTDEFASMAFVTPAAGMLIVPLEVIGPPVNPAPVATLVTVPLPPAPGKVCPEANVKRPLLAMENPVSPGAVPFEPNSKFNELDAFAVLFAVGSAIHRKSCATADELVLLNADACKSNGFELKPFVAVAVPVLGKTAPASETLPLNVPVAADSPPVNAAVVPESPPVSAPPISCK
jgi:hypothetical protein